MATVANLVDGLERSIHRMGIELPVDIAGNSLGGSMALGERFARPPSHGVGRYSVALRVPLLLHGIGMSHAAWSAVTPYLCATRRVIAFDTAGFGLTPPLPSGTDPKCIT